MSGFLVKARPDPTKLPAHKVRVSKRARYVRLQITASKGLEIILPEGTKPDAVPEILKQNLTWINRQLAQAQVQRSARPDAGRAILPLQLALLALEEQWRVEYVAFSAKTHNVLERAGRELVVNCQPSDFSRGSALLQAWLRTRARHALVPQLSRLSAELSLPYAGTTVRAQRTRWASCSSKKVINLNYKLIFLPPDLVRHVFLHELCHTIHLNHSPRYWRLVYAKEPDYRRFEAELNRAGQYIPTWVDDR